jgi:CRP/FNR family cyclic AMP-dependent transcriptional regulator
MSSMFQRFAKTFQKGDIIFCEFEPGDTFYLIQTGRVEIVKIMGDLQKTVDVLQPGEVFGEMAILEEVPRSATAIALDKVTALEFNRENFEILMQGNPQIAMKLLKLFTKRIYDQKRRFMVLKLDDPQARVADVFLMLNESNPQQGAEGAVREFKASLDDIAHWAGMSGEAAREVLSHFATQRRVELLQDRIIVKNISDFQRFVNTKRKKS